MRITKSNIHLIYPPTQKEIAGKSRFKRTWVEFPGGKRYCVRSSWEELYCYYLEFLKSHNEIIDWWYEPETFWFDKIKRGVVSYTPDFKIIQRDSHIEFHEVKGYMDSKSITKIKRFRRYYPQFPLVVVDEAQIRAIRAQSSLFYPQ